MPRKSKGFAADTGMTECRPLDGRTRQAKALKAAGQERDAIQAGLLESLNRKPTTLDILASRNIASLQVLVDRLEARGADASEPRRLLVQLLRASGLRPQPIAAPEKQPVNWTEYLERTAAKFEDLERIAANLVADAEGPTC